MNALELTEFTAEVEDMTIVDNIDLSLEPDETTVIMGPNGSGKSTLAKSIMGHPEYEVSGSAKLFGEELLDMEPDERSQEGLFLGFQYPVEIPGVTVSNFLRRAVNARRPDDDPIDVPTFVKNLNEKMELLGIPDDFAQRYMNEGFSGGERKKMEILQLAVLEPKVAILDETDSGLDVDALQQVCSSLNDIKERSEDMSYLIITHYERMLNYVNPDTVCIMKDGQIAEKGGPELATTLEEEGYQAFDLQE
jgi:Fe-S cluster assembly ATP-binding protein